MNFEEFVNDWSLRTWQLHGSYIRKRNAQCLALLVGTSRWWHNLSFGLYALWSFVYRTAHPRQFPARCFLHLVVCQESPQLLEFHRSFDQGRNHFRYLKADELIYFMLTVSCSWTLENDSLGRCRYRIIWISHLNLLLNYCCQNHYVLFISVYFLHLRCYLQAKESHYFPFTPSISDCPGSCPK